MLLTPPASSVIATIAILVAVVAAPADAFSAATLLCLVNYERALYHVPALTLSSELTAAALHHSLDQARHGRMTHLGSDGSSPGNRISRAGYKWTESAENVAYGHIDEVHVVRGWMLSWGHRLNILNPHYSSMGAAMVLSALTRKGVSAATTLHGAIPFYTQDFATGGKPGTHVDCKHRKHRSALDHYIRTSSLPIEHYVMKSHTRKPIKRIHALMGHRVLKAHKMGTSHWTHKDQEIGWSGV